MARCVDPIDHNRPTPWTGHAGTVAATSLDRHRDRCHLCGDWAALSIDDHCS
ncbi:hypothetical protein [Synechococcus sp. CC9902]|uniref:hypothetical protein n=1 Tax=Synechococcus sp. (strain CC9902) TaxID=316279 RepID=UPI0012E9D29C|nr:hypothetical protein [Synechococcus sp. CC9902]